MKIEMMQPSVGQAVWHHKRDGVLAIGVWTERDPGNGEDAEPLWIHHVPTGAGIMGVFDGSGGSGASIAYSKPPDPPRSGAWVGARVARASVESWFTGCIQDGAQPDPESLRRHLGLQLARARPADRSKIVGTMRHDLPTTMAVVQYCLIGEQVACRALWAGDSRVYSLTPHGGLQALTRDHTVETDALIQLLQDPPLTNVVCADHPFVVDEHSLVLGLPCVLVSATDGFFGYVQTPAHFECHLLGTLRNAPDASRWALMLAREVAGYTADDASLSITALGYSDFDQLRKSFDARAQAFLTHFWRPAPRAADGREGLKQWRIQTWDDYRPGYEELMPQADRERR